VEEFLSRNGVPFRVRDVDREPLDARELWALFNRKQGRLRVPFVALNDGEDVVLGYDPQRLEEVFVRGELVSRTAEEAHKERVVYDDFRSPDLDPARWAIAEMRQADGSPYRYADPNARVTTGQGSLELTINPFSRWHDSVQTLNNPKQLYISTRRFETPPGSVVDFETDMAITTYGQIPYSLRDAFGTMNLLDFRSGMVLDFAATNDTSYVVYERLHIPGVTTKEEYFAHRIVLEVEARPGLEHHLMIRYDRDRNSAEWFADGERVYWAEVPVPVEGFNLGMGLFSSREIGRYSRAEREHGQGATGRWGPWLVTTRVGTVC
jgi:hypothetical protein